MLFAITSRSYDGLEKKVLAVQEGLSRISVFYAIKPILEKVANRLGENFYMKNWETWGIDNTLFSVEELPKITTEAELEEHLLRTYVDHSSVR